VPFLRGVERGVISQIALNLEPMLFVPAEIAPPGYLYIVQHGIAICGDALIRRGMVWGIDVLLGNESSSARMLTYVQVLRLERTLLIEIAERFPRAYRKMRWAALRLTMKRYLDARRQRKSSECALQSHAPASASAFTNALSSSTSEMDAAEIHGLQPRRHSVLARRLSIDDSPAAPNKGSDAVCEQSVKGPWRSRSGRHLVAGLREASVEGRRSGLQLVEDQMTRLRAVLMFTRAFGFVKRTSSQNNEASQAPACEASKPHAKPEPVARTQSVPAQLLSGGHGMQHLDVTDMLRVVGQSKKLLSKAPLPERQLSRQSSSTATCRASSSGVGTRTARADDRRLATEVADRTTERAEKAVRTAVNDVLAGLRTEMIERMEEMRRAIADLQQAPRREAATYVSVPSDRVSNEPHESSTRQGTVARFVDI